MSEKLRLPIEEVVGDGREASPKHEIRLMRVLEEARRPLHYRHINMLANTDGFDEINPGSLSFRLSRMHKVDLIVRVARGVYSLPEFAAEAYESPREQIQDKLEDILRHAGQALTRKEINLQLQERYPGEISADSLSQTLSRMVAMDTVVRTGRGSYSLPEFAGEEYELPGKTVGERVQAALWRTGKPLHRADICRVASADGYGEINPGSVFTTLPKLARINLLVRVEKGVYALPEFSYASDSEYESYANKPEIIAKVVRIFKKLGGTASADRIHFYLTDGNLKGLSVQHVFSLLDRMADSNEASRKIVKIDENAYCLSKLANTEYKELESTIKDRVLAILKACATPLHVIDIRRHFVKHGYELVAPDNISNVLSFLVDAGEIVRLAHGVYALEEFAAEAYELPALNVNLRIELSLLSAARPLHVSEIRQALNADDHKDVSPVYVQSQLSELLKESRIVRLAHGVYALEGFAGEAYELPWTSIKNRLEVALGRAARPLSVAEAYRRINTDGRGIVNLETAKSELRQMFADDRVVRVARGVYALEEFAAETYEPASKTISYRLLSVFNTAGRPLARQELVQALSSDGLRAVRAGSIYSALKRLTDEAKVIRMSYGVYGRPEFADGASGSPDSDKPADKS